MKELWRRIAALERTKSGEVMIIRIVEEDADGRRVPVEQFIVEGGKVVRSELLDAGRDDAE
jgi:hypothetical protein